MTPPSDNELDRLLRDQESMRLSIDDMTKTFNQNLIKVMQEQASSKSWQESHERLEDERWKMLGVSLGEVKGLLETIPVKVGEDLAKFEEETAKEFESLERRVTANQTLLTAHDKSISFLKGAWFALTAVAAVLAFLIGALKVVR